MFSIGLSSCSKVADEALFRSYRESGIERMEISLHPEEYAELNYRALSELSKRYGVCLWSYHLPFSPSSRIDISNPNLARETVSYFYELIKKAADIGIDKFIIHASGEPITDADRPRRMQCAKESLASLAELALREGAVLAVEDLPRTCLGRNSQEILELISGHDSLRVCFDTNHLLKESNVDFIRAVGKKIITTHVSDYDFVDEKHWLPGEGAVDWHAVVSTLKEVGYDGVWLYELGFACPKTVIRDRDLTCRDFVRNAEEIFQNKKITVLSRPAPPQP